MSINIMYKFGINRFKCNVSFKHNPILPPFKYNSVQQTIFGVQHVLMTSLA